MSRKDDDEGLLVIFAIIVALGIIYYVAMWILANWVPILILLILIGLFTLGFYWTKNQRKEKEQTVEITKTRNLDAEQEEMNENLRVECEQRVKEFDERQKLSGLIEYRDRFGNQKYGNTKEIEKWEKEDSTEKIKDLLINKIVTVLTNFKPIRKWENEDGYHKELLGYLRHDFPDIKYEFQQGSSRPDLVIKNIAIELKGPTDNVALDTLTTKCLKYSKYYDHLIIVLFDPRFSEGHFKEIKDGINHYFPHVVVIRK